ncbi:uncharacterized protein LOC132746347 [Ruditapes philippinarum]|uniref:uncharacterized protein LOC132746347 n=1 Tax=Ruditapes philippinarum TaxID=129788 RepID=UPI00295BA59E|nr:uncharacterized protein LOC132746347 [Ruditapes philippinarum]XP_060591444.1 uncharacterized protein LOC132746347 [Ruditapes philippinarum]
MKSLAILTVLIGFAYGANHMCWSVDRISDELVKLADVNKDGIVQQSELTDELLNDWNLSNGTCLSYHDFTKNWALTFHDHHDTSHAFFNNLDLDNDKQLCFSDVAVQIAKYDQNPTDGQIQPAEMNAFMHAVHPDSHKNGGHGHGC